MLVEGRFPITAAPDELIRHLFDVRLMASCLPGCESLEALADDRYRAVVAVGLAGITARFDLQVEVTRRDERNVWTLTRGEEGSHASALRAETQVTLVPEGAVTQVEYRSEVSLTGRLGRFGLGVMKKKAQAMGDEFAAKLRTELERRHAGAPAAAAPAPLPLPWWQRWWRALLGLFGGRRTAA
ncbi:MAG: SRPBCC domain-containing protein [Burkholderiaceae bacterium]